MYCTKCGKEIADNDSFCSNCGQNQNKRIIETNSGNGDKNKPYAFYIAIATSPILFIIRMLSQTSKHIDAGVGGAWRSYDTIVVPDNIKAIMIMIVIASTILNALLRKNGNSTNNSKCRITKVLLFINIIFGIFITFIQF